MEFVSAHSPVYANVDHTIIDLMVQFEGLDFEIPFAASPFDTTDHGQIIYAKAVAGDFGVVAAFVPLGQPPRQFTSLEFLDLFTDAEQLAVASAAMASAQVKLWYDRMLAASFVSLADPRTSAGLQALVTASLITQARMDAILVAMG